MGRIWSRNLFGNTIQVGNDYTQRFIWRTGGGGQMYEICTDNLQGVGISSANFLFRSLVEHSACQLNCGTP